MKKIFLLLAISFATLQSHAQEATANTPGEQITKEKIGQSPITFKTSFFFGINNVSNHFIGAQNFSGLQTGLAIDFGRFFNRWQNISWDASVAYSSNLGGKKLGFENTAETSAITIKSISGGYNAFYNWSFGKGLMIKAGGGLDVYGDLISETRFSTNNSLSVNILAQLEATVGISYVFQFKKWMLGLSGNISTPFAGLIFTDSKHESGAGTIVGDGLMKRYDNHFKGTSFSNSQGMNYELEIKFITPRVAISVGTESDNRWWYVNEIQNYRKNTFFKVGLSFNLVSLKQTKTINRYF